MNNRSTFFTGAICIISLVLVVFGALYGLGIFNQEKILPIKYPSDAWLRTSNNTMAVACKQSLNAKQNLIYVDMEINGVYDTDNGQALEFVQAESKALPYKLYICDYTYTYCQVNFAISMKIYDKATIDNGDIVEGKGFVIEVVEFSIVDGENKTPCELESMTIYAIYENSDDKKLI